MNKHPILERDEKGRIVGRALGDCSVCGEPAKSKGMCLRHYYQAWRKDHPESDEKHKKEYWAFNKDKRKAILDRHYKKNKAKILAKQAVFYVANKEVLLKRSSKWKKENPEQSRRIASRRRARKNQAGGDHTVAQIKALYTKQGGKCPICRITFKGKKYNVDHVVPLFRGGSNGIENIQLLCETCNKQKGAKDPIHFMQSRGFLL